MSEAGSNKIGVVIDVSADTIAAKLISGDDAPLGSPASAKTSLKVGQIGAYLLVSQFNSQILVMVERSYQSVDG
ncbi:MAG: hypothetical protein AAGB19_14110, partial [Cyanobacteria bacterium P01_F01_bin.3]